MPSDMVAQEVIDRISEVGQHNSSALRYSSCSSSANNDGQLSAAMVQLLTEALEDFDEPLTCGGREPAKYFGYHHSLHVHSVLDHPASSVCSTARSTASDHSTAVVASDHSTAVVVPESKRYHKTHQLSAYSPIPPTLSAVAAPRGDALDEFIEAFAASEREYAQLNATVSDDALLRHSNPIFPINSHPSNRSGPQSRGVP